MWTYLLGPVLALAPQRWRAQHLSRLAIDWRQATFISGLAEALLSFPLLLVWHSIFIAGVLETFSQTGDPFGNREGLFGITWFWLNPITWLVAFSGVEGVVRALGALCAGETRGISLFAAAGYLYHRLRPTRASAQLPLVCDEITPGGGTSDIKIAACRPKAGWKYPFTIRYARSYFQVIGELNLDTGPRPYVYMLRRLPQGAMTGGLQDYDPEDVLRERRPLEPVEQ